MGDFTSYFSTLTLGIIVAKDVPNSNRQRVFLVVNGFCSSSDDEHTHSKPKPYKDLAIYKMSARFKDFRSGVHHQARKSNQGSRRKGVTQMLTEFRVDGSQTLIKSRFEGGATNVAQSNKCGTPFRKNIRSKKGGMQWARAKIRHSVPLLGGVATLETGDIGATDCSMVVSTFLTVRRQSPGFRRNT